VRRGTKKHGKKEEVGLMVMRTFPTLDELIRRFDTDLADLVGRTDTASSGSERRLLPAMEVRRTDAEYVVRMELPGVDPDSMDVSVDGSILRVRAERRGATEEQGEPCGGRSSTRPSTERLSSRSGSTPRSSPPGTRTGSWRSGFRTPASAP
jgi:HSP20 family molecular chaperone IbpA